MLSYAAPAPPYPMLLAIGDPGRSFDPSGERGLTGRGLTKRTLGKGADTLTGRRLTDSTQSLERGLTGRPLPAPSKQGRGAG